MENPICFSGQGLFSNLSCSMQVYATHLQRMCRDWRLDRTPYVRWYKSSNPIRRAGSTLRPRETRSKTGFSTATQSILLLIEGSSNISRPVATHKFSTNIHFTHLSVVVTYQCNVNSSNHSHRHLRDWRDTFDNQLHSCSQTAIPITHGNFNVTLTYCIRVIHLAIRVGTTSIISRIETLISITSLSPSITMLYSRTSLTIGGVKLEMQKIFANWIV